VLAFEDGAEELLDVPLPVSVDERLHHGGVLKLVDVESAVEREPARLVLDQRQLHARETAFVDDHVAAQPAAHSEDFGLRHLVRVDRKELRVIYRLHPFFGMRIMIFYIYLQLLNEDRIGFNVGIGLVEGLASR